MTGPRGDCHLGDEPLRTGDVIQQIGTASTLAAGDPWREMPCLACHKPIGGEPFAIIAILSLADMPSPGGHIPAAAYAAHESHHLGPDDDLLPLAIAHHRHFHQRKDQPQ